METKNKENQTNDTKEDLQLFSLSADLINQVITIYPSDFLSKNIANDSFQEKTIERMKTLLTKERAPKPLKITRDVEEIMEEIKEKKEVIISRKINPIDGEDACFELLAKQEQVGEEENLEEREERKIDHKRNSSVILVKKEDLIARKKKKVLGVDGSDIYGYKIKARQPSDINVICNNSIDVLEDYKYFYYYATKNGALIIKDCEKKCILDIRPCMVVENVDYATGNIQMNGDIIVKGTITDGFRVHATGNIYIYGEKGVGQADSIVSDNGDIYVSGGVCGNGRTILKARNNIIAKYLNGVSAISGNEIKLNDYCINSIIKTPNLIISGMKGSLYGGEIMAEKIFVAKLGSMNEIKTKIYFTEKAKMQKSEIISLIKNKKQELEERNNQLKTNKVNISNKLREVLSSQKNKEIDRNYVLKIKNAITEIDQELQKNQSHIQELEKKNKDTQASDNYTLNNEEYLILGISKKENICDIKQMLLAKYVYSNVYIYIGDEIKKVFHDEQKNTYIDCNGIHLHERIMSL